MKNNLFRIAAIAIVTMLISSCVHKADMESLKAVSFSSDIQPILAGNCAMSGCHSDDHSGSGGEEGEFPLVTYDDVINHGDVKGGDARGSKLYQTVTNRGEQLMPPDPRPMLTEDQLKLIYIWIEQGAKNN